MREREKKKKTIAGYSYHSRTQEITPFAPRGIRLYPSDRILGPVIKCDTSKVPNIAIYHFTELLTQTVKSARIRAQSLTLRIWKLEVWKGTNGGGWGWGGVEYYRSKGIKTTFGIVEGISRERPTGKR
ncbi:hypothetical protein CEXT_772021 [Caerostris extrusa]|uniref:Uncharacterized protein n=1 Tax=Caerostris extrusa TaxID=172846 RepID=A0AAV4MR99_CAEEX|nr:hypothetical protein CEXT_772021 [Caerostris extrusa]